MQQEMVQGFRLSPQQKQLWARQSASSSYRVQGAWRLEGTLDINALAEALRRLVNRHEILRTAFRSVPGLDIPLQVIAEENTPRLKESDLSAHGEDEQGTLVEEYFQRELESPFDFARESLLQAHLLRLTTETHVLIAGLPALCGDAWTLKNLMSELGQLYEQTVDGAPEAEEPVQYVQFSEWQNELQESEEDEEGRAYWRQQKAAQTVSLPLERKPAAKLESQSLKKYEVSLAREVFEMAGRLASAHEVATSTVLLACWQALLWRLTGRSEVVVSVSFDGRIYEEMQPALGLYAKWLPVRAHFDETTTLAASLNHLREAVRVAAARQQYFSPEFLQTDDREAIGEPTLPIGFEYEERPPAGARSGGLNVSLLNSFCWTEPLKLRLSCIRKGDALRIECHYDSKLYAAEYVANLAGEFQTLLRSALASPGTPLALIDVLSADERGRMLSAWQGAKREFATGDCLHRLFEAQAARTPDAAAVLYRDEQLSFAELNERANRLAHYLRELGVGAEVRVALLLERSPEMLVGVLAVLKAGGAYVPLDVTNPPQRLSLMLRDASAAVLLTQQSLIEKLPELSSQTWRVVNLDAERERIAARSTANVEAATSADNLAYIIYTSGSTGTPKGVMVQHRQALHLLAALQHAVFSPHGERPRRFSLNAPLAFDASVKHLIQIATGNALVVVPEEVRADPHALLQYITKQRIDVLDCTPSHLRLLLDYGLGEEWPDEAERWRPEIVLVGGEAIDEKMWSRLTQHQETAYYNVYGPTETTVDATISRIEESGADGIAQPLIGRALANVEVYILDERQELLPTGVVGEICLGGSGVARGYAGNPAATAEKFVPHPFSRAVGARLYRTGDTGRFTPDGEIEYTGRNDGQVKMRGHRIEVREVESVLAEHAGVREAVVVAREEPGAEGPDMRLVAYIVPRHRQTHEIDGRVRHRLPNGMAIVQQNRSETDYLYEEIFEDKIYFKHGVRLPPHACVFDVGANIGMFTLYVSQHCPDARVYAFEPIKPIFETLRINAELYGRNVKLFPFGLAATERSASFSYYPNFSARSGLSEFANAEDEVAVTKRFLRNKEASGVAGMGELADAADELLEGFFTSESIECELKRVSDVIRAEGVERIDLLKVDVQQSELQVLQGIDEADWPKVQQVAMEVHDAPGQASEGRVGLILDLLRHHGFDAVAEQDEALRGTDRHSVYGVRREASAATPAPESEELRPLEPDDARPGENGHALYRLPNGFEVFHQNRNETEFIYKQIFEDKVYLRHGISIEPGDCIFDVGANIGLFTIFIYDQCRTARVFSFEPIPATFEKLRSNVGLYGLGASLFNCGLSDRVGTTTFTYYPHWSASSGAYADVHEEEEAFKAFLSNQGELVAEYADQLVEGRYEGEQIVCRLTTVSETIKQHRVERIDLLKLDVEKSELDVLNGITPEDWAKVKQVVIELHDIEGRLAHVTAMLEGYGFAVAVEQDASLKGSNIYALYASRQQQPRQTTAGQRAGEMPAPVVDYAELTPVEVRQYLKDKLPEYMIPSAFVMLDKLPLTTNGKVDRRALPAPEEAGASQESAVTPPRTPVEEVLAGIWAEVLKLKRVGIDENFFELGGHSLLATQLMSRVREAFQVEMPLRTLFEMPTVAELGEKIESALKTGESLDAPPIVRVGREQSLPLSFAQQRLWFIAQLEPESASYNNPLAVRLTGTLDVGALERTLNEITRRHEVLRTHFAAVGGRPVQVVEEAREQKLEVVELGGLEASEREAEARRRAAEEALAPFDLARGPLMRVKLLRLGDGEHLLLVTMHHIVTDGWSLGVLVREVATLYEAFARGAASPLPDLTVQYADFAHWQREWLQGEVLDKHLAYWREQLQGAPAMLELPTDRPRPSVQTFVGGYETFELTAELSERLKTLSRQQGVTLFMTLLAGFQLLLSRYSGQEDIVVGADVANRNRRETEDLIGFFVNMMVLRTDLSGEPTFRELLRRVREVTLGAYAHQDLPFEKLVEELQPERSLSHTPLFQVSIVLQNQPMGELELPGLTLGMFETEDVAAKYDLLLSLVETEEGITGSLVYNTALFNAATIQRMAGHLRMLLENVVTTPDARLGDLSLLSPAELLQLTSVWNDTRRALPETLSIHRLFEQQAAQTPGAVALTGGAEQVSYAELNRRANQLARHLQTLGIGADMPVGLCMERSVGMVVAMLGILKAGGAYVPLDAQYPLERLAWMMEDAGVNVLVTEERMEDALPAHWGQVVVADRDGVEIARHSAENLTGERAADGETGGEGLAYIIYTSGSTGVPKGVCVPHRGVVRLVKNTDYAQLTPADTVAQASNSSFDAATFEVWGALLNGARLVIVDKETALSPPAYAAQIAATGIDTIFMTTALFNQMAREVPTVFRSLRHLMFGGEQVEPRWVAQVLEHGAPGRLLHVYGPTETTTFASWHLIDEVAPEATNIPIGKPLANTQIYVLDRSLRPVPVGVKGEVYIGGPGLARGYFKRPDATAEKFIPHPFAVEPGARLYRTGDLARLLSDGSVEFLGRADHQVKMRGFRIELGEIEAALSQHAGVAACTVVAREEGEWGRRLVAYVVAAEGAGEAASSVATWRRSLQERLPDYMVPSAFVMLDALPLTANGKVDRRALPAPDDAVAVRAESYVAPRTPLEEIITNVWGEVLRVERVSVTDNFFDLGGHSLLATQVVSRLREACGVEVALRLLFEEPTVEGLSRGVEELLRAGAGVSAPLITAAARDGELPLSFAQQRLWFIDQFEPGSATYNIPAAIRLRGKLDVEALRATLTEVARRHEALRTHFESSGSEPVQVISAPAAVSLSFIDLSQLPSSECEVEVLHRVGEEAARPFDLNAGPLFRATLMQLGEQEHVVLLTMHHIISDGWSMGVLVKEVAALYDAYTQGLPSPLPELPVQYADFAVWQRAWLQGDVLDAQLSYWREQLAAAPQVLELPTDHPRPAVQTNHGAAEVFTLSTELSEGLRALSKSEGATLFMTLLAAFQALLYRYSGQRDILVGTPIANRNRAETEALIGFFVNTLVLRGRLSSEMSFGELVKQAREVCLGAYAHQDVPFEKLVEELQPERSLSHSPLFQTLFALQNAPGGELQLPGLTLESVESEAATTKFDLSLVMDEAGGELGGSLSYKTDLFDAATAKRMVGHFVRLLESVVGQPATRLVDLPLMDASEERRLLVEWNDTRRDYSTDRCVTQLFEAQAARTPDAVAVVCGQERFTYGELERQANQLAHHLRALGVGPEVLVGILLERSAEMVVALLGVLKAGGAYLPLDPEYPRERLSFMLEDAGVRLVLTEKSLRERVPAGSATLVCLDSEREAIARCNAVRLLRTRASAEDLAYVIYTSGSTGRPKGASVTHGGLVNCLHSMQEIYRLDDSDAFMFKTSLNFDPSVWEVFWPLAVGARVVVARAGGQLDGDYLSETIERERVTTAYFVPTMLRAFVEAETSGRAAPSLRRVICGGEKLSPETMRLFFERFHGVELHHSYGPTEASIAASEWTCDSSAVTARGKVLMGRPLANVRLYVLDARMRPAPTGAAGELYIGGSGVGRGYLNRPALTAEWFVPDPFAPGPGSRLYRTGDLVRYEPDGNVEFIGRADQQVKLRGYRLEPGEIEAALRSHASVTEAAVVLREDPRAGKQLVAYVAGESPASAPELRAHLREQLPDYMMPARFVLLERLPLMSNGKVDRKALPAPPDSYSEAADSDSEPRTPLEEIVAGVWAQVLRVERVGRHDNFFARGGHSLLATQVVSRLRDACGVEVTLRTMFERPTVAELSRSVEELMRAGKGVGAPSIERVGREGLLPLSFAQQRLWFIDQLEPDSPTYNLPTALRLTGSLDAEALRATLTEVVRRHESLRTLFVQVDGEPAQLILPERPPHLTLTDLSYLPGSEREAEVRRMAAAEALGSFDLDAGPLMRAGLIRLQEQEHVVMLTMHHIISDGWSMGVLVKEVAALYEAFTQGLPSPLPELPVQYADFAVWQRAWLQGAVLDAQLKYWREQLAAAPQVLELPTDHPRPAVQTNHGAAEVFTLSTELSERLRALSKSEGATLFMTLLAAFQALLYRYSGQTDILVGTPIANRNRAETEALIGFFVNTLVLRGRLSSEMSFGELVKQAREVCLGAYAHQDVPFEKLVEELQPERSLSHSPLFQVMFILQNAPADELRLSTLEIGGVEVESGVTKFDLTMALADEGEEIAGTIGYRSDLFEAATIRRMAGHFERLLEAVVEDARQGLGQVSLLSEAERRHLSKEWNETGIDYGARSSSLHQLFEAQAARTPDAVAVSYEGRQLTYAELNARANRLAHHLSELGVAPEARVGLLLEHSFETIVGLLGVLKAGGAYVPLDAHAPPERLRFMLEDAGVAVVLTQERTRGNLPESIRAAEVCLDSGVQLYAHQSADNPHANVSPSNTAYIIYTSGSTGRPKGVGVPHAAVVNYISWAAQEYVRGESLAFPLYSSLAFDLTVTSIYTPLVSGGRVVIYERTGGAGVLEEILQDDRVDVVKLTPGHLALIKERDNRRSRVRLLVVGGESLETELTRAVSESFGGSVEIVNEYGPTEATVGCMIYRYDAARDARASVPIGRPAANTQVYVLDESLQPSPVGVPGQLYVGGDGLARGYHARPGLTAESFIPDPFSRVPGRRLYRTGDKARHLDAGQIEFLGRADEQLKVRGYRVEPGEIEAVMMQHGSVGACVVAAREDAEGGKRLVAYVVLQDGAAMPGGGAWREHLRETLPEYMLPQSFVQIPAVPLTPNGKVDRKALPAPEQLEPESSENYVAARTTVEATLVKIWSEVLGVARVGIYDDFFELGGHSLLAARMMTRLRETFRVHVALRAVFEQPTVAYLSECVEAALRSQGR